MLPRDGISSIALGRAWRPARQTRARRGVRGLIPDGENLARQERFEVLLLFSCTCETIAT